MTTQSNAMKFVERAIKNGEMARPDQCEICTTVPTPHPGRDGVNPMTHQTEIELALCQRDYQLMDEYHTGLLTRIEQAVKSGVTPQQIRRWAKNVTNEAELLQRVYNAARWLASDGEKAEAAK